MSMVYITEHNECIYNVTKKPEGQTETKELMYKSCNAQRIKTERKHPKLYKERGTMGPPQILPPEPKEFLRKGTGKPPMLHPKLMDPDYGKPHGSSGPRKPPVPLTLEVIKEQDEKLKHPQKDFITRNVKAAVTMKPSTPKKRVVIDCSGTEKPLGPGLEPEHIYSRVFGKIPTYLDKLIRIKERQEQVKRDLANKTQPKCHYITSEEREKLLLGLKQNWEELQTQYQGLPLLTDTIPKINRKSKLEAALKQLEKDIVLVERHPYIYVYNDDELL